MADVAGKLERLGSQRPADAVFGVSLGPVLKDPRRGGETQNIVDDGRLAEQAGNRRQGQFDPNLAPLSFQAFQE